MKEKSIETDPSILSHQSTREGLDFSDITWLAIHQSPPSFLEDSRLKLMEFSETKEGIEYLIILTVSGTHSSAYDRDMQSIE